MPEITKDRTQLIERAATELGALPSGQSLSTEDRNTIDNLVDPLIYQLSFDGVVNIQDADAIESQYFLALARLLANEAAPSFGQGTSAEIKAICERTLRKLSATGPTGETLRALYY